MQQALQIGLAQSGLLVHQRCVVTPAGYPRIPCSLPEKLRLYQCISGYLIASQMRWYVIRGSNVAQTTSCAVGFFLSRSTLLDTLTTSELEAKSNDQVGQGE